MKLIVLVDANPYEYRKILEAVKNKNPYSFTTGNCEEIKEYNDLYNLVENFSQMDKELMLVRFSGKETIVQSLGGERPEMIIPLSYDKESPYYMEDPLNVFLDFLTSVDTELQVV